MKFRFVWLGKTKDKNWRALQEEYLQRLSHFVKFELIELKDSAAHETKENEGKRIAMIFKTLALFDHIFSNAGRMPALPANSKAVEKSRNS